ncbi:hypothetical protein GCM10009765_58630 [Fodinicola feengrottensis]|uniref:Uncharacterized protein n=1 Tax=Fodinicola feengrottensis TaxID=435914 RepID=A0ABN2IB12_9ACTN
MAAAVTVRVYRLAGDKLREIGPAEIGRLGRGAVLVVDGEPDYDTTNWGAFAPAIGLAVLHGAEVRRRVRK